jgi:hypothetical protein
VANFDIDITTMTAHADAASGFRHGTGWHEFHRSSGQGAKVTSITRAKPDRSAPGVADRIPNAQ